MQALILALLMITNVGAREAYPLLDSTPKVVCDQLLLGAKHGQPYDGWGLKIARWLVSLRYEVRTIGLDAILARGEGGITFLPNHTGLNDPIVMVTTIGKKTHVRPVMTQAMTRGFFGAPVKQLLGMVNGFVLPESSGGRTAIGMMRAVLREMTNATKNGDNALIYASGGLQLSAEERVGNKAAVEMILEDNPDARLVLVRERGLWGSSWSHGAPESDPENKSETAQLLKRGIWQGFKMMLGNGFFFLPKRQVTLEFFEPMDFPRHGTRAEMNAYLDNFYNAPPEARTFVKRYAWQKGPDVTIAEQPINYRPPETEPNDGEVADAKSLPKLIKIIADFYGSKNLDADMSLEDAGVDSVTRESLYLDIGDAFGIEVKSDLAVHTIRELAEFVDQATPSTEVHQTSKIQIQPSGGWLADFNIDAPVNYEIGQTIPEMIVRKALEQPGKTIAEDQLRGAITYKKLLTRAWAMAKVFADLPGERIGLLMPALGADTILYLAAHLAGKTPVFVNFTGRPDQVAEVLKNIEVETIISARTIYDKLQRKYDFSPYMEKFVYLEDLKFKIAAQLPRAVLDVKFNPLQIVMASRQTEDAVVLLTSGSSGAPKAVRLSHRNIMTNVKDLNERLKIRADDRLLISLPPFHSFGHMVQVLSMVLGVPAVYHPQIEDARTISELIGAYKVTIIAGPPTLITPIADKTDPAKLDSVRLIFVGAEALKQQQIDKNHAGFRHADLLEGYGATETSPVIAVNPPGAAKLGTVGVVLKSLQYKIVDVETNVEVPSGKNGVLMVRGPSVFSGYLKPDPALESPFVKLADGLKYYNTGDVVSEDADHYITIHDRISRFSKQNGEMVSHSAVEKLLAPLAEKLRPAGESGPIIAVEALDNSPITLFTTVDLDLASVQKLMREKNAGGASLVRAVKRVDQIDMLGTGKVDYKALKETLK